MSWIANTRNIGVVDQKLQKRLKRAKEALEHLKKEEDPALADLVEKHPDSLVPEALDKGNEREVRVAAQSRTD